MPDSNPNQSNPDFSNEELELAKGFIATLKGSLTFIHPVSDDQVKGAAKIDDGRESFIRDVINEMINSKGKIPTLASLEKLVLLYAYYGYAYDIEDILRDLLTLVVRARMVFGGLTYDQASRHYKGLDAAIKDKAEGAVESKKRLAKYFANNNNNGGDKPDKGTDDKPK